MKASAVVSGLERGKIKRKGNNNNEFKFEKWEWQKLHISHCVDHFLGNATVNDVGRVDEGDEVTSALFFCLFVLLIIHRTFRHRRANDDKDGRKLGSAW